MALGQPSIPGAPTTSTQPSPPLPAPPLPGGPVAPTMATQLINLGGLPTLPASSTIILIAGWISMLTAGETFVLLNDTRAGGVTVTLSSITSGQTAWYIAGRDSTGANIFVANVTTTPDFQTGWHSYAISVDTTTQVIQLLIDLTLFTFTSSSPGVTWSSTHPIAFFPGTDLWEMGPVTPAGGYGVDMSDFWFDATVSFFDLSLSSNQDKLFCVGNGPISWGADGSEVTGTPPAVFLEGNSLTYPNNLGTGGPFSIDGLTLTDVLGPNNPCTSTLTLNAWYQSFSVGGKFTDLPLDEWDSNYEIFDVQMPVDVTFQINFAGSPTPGCETAPGSTATLTFQTIHAGTPTTVGTLVIAGASTGGTFNLASSLMVPAGDRLRLYAPAAVDATVAGLFGTIVGTR